MKNPAVPVVSPLLRLAPAGLLFALALSNSSAFAESAPAPAKTHTLFMGTDFSVEWNGALRPVQSVQGSSFVVLVDGQPVVVPASRTDLRIKMDDTLKLTSRFATVTDFKADRAYTPANDPRERYHGKIDYALGAGDVSDLAARDMRNAQASAGLARAAANAAPLDSAAQSSVGGLDAAALGAESNYSQSLNQGQSANADVSSHIIAMEAELAKKLFDAFELTFNVSSEKPLEQPYMVVVTHYRETPGATKSSRLWVYAEALPRIDAKPQRIRLFRGGFPPGYELQDVRIQLYDHGSELATTVARKQVPLSRDEAFEYAVLDYIGENKDKTAGPAPAKVFWPEDLASRLPAEKQGQVLYVKVNKDGLAVSFVTDESGAKPRHEPELDALLPDLRFNPALAKGKPVEGIAALKIGKRN